MENGNLIATVVNGFAYPRILEELSAKSKNTTFPGAIIQALRIKNFWKARPE